MPESLCLFICFFAEASFETIIYHFKKNLYTLIDESTWQFSRPHCYADCLPSQEKSMFDNASRFCITTSTNKPLTAVDEINEK
jgi:hypothetical protein